MHNIKNLFPGQHPQEKIVVFTRRHPIVIAGSVAAVFAMVAAYIAALIVILNAGHIPLVGGARIVVFGLTGTVLLMAWLYLYVRFVDYFLDVWILTDERIVQIKQRSLFNREIAEFDLVTVQDVSSQVRGVFGTFLNYGTIFAQTAAARDLFEFKYIPNPSRVEQLILDLQEGARAKAKEEIGRAARSGEAMTPVEGQELRHDVPGLD